MRLLTYLSPSYSNEKFRSFFVDWSYETYSVSVDKVIVSDVEHVTVQVICSVDEFIQCNGKFKPELTFKKLHNN